MIKCIKNEKEESEHRKLQELKHQFLYKCHFLHRKDKFYKRFENIHVKDMIKSESEHGGFESCILGKGLVATKEVTDLSKAKGGTRVFVIEQESYQGKSPLDCMKEDLAIMKQWGY